jgi:hypothetical protein
MVDVRNPSGLIFVGVALGACGGTLLAVGDYVTGFILVTLACLAGWGWDQWRREEREIGG